MNNNIIYFLPKYYSKNAILAFFIALVICSFLFRSNILPLQWIAFSIIGLVGFFYFASRLTTKWSHFSEEKFKQSLFGTTFFLQLLWVIFSYYYFIYQTGQPFDFESADSITYHTSASDLAERGFAKIDSALWGMGLSDRGFPIYLSIIYMIFGNYVIIPRILNAFWGAWGAILIYKIAKRNFGESAGRIAGVFAMLLPNFIYYAGLHLKEPVMIFLLLAFMERADYLLRGNRITFLNIIIACLLGASLFFFRTVLGLSAIFALFSSLLLSKKTGVNWLNRLVLITWFLIITWMFLATRIQGEINYLIQGQDQQEVNMQYRAAREGGNELATYGTAVVFLPFMFVAPFPTLVNIESQQQQMLLAGAYFVKNIFSFFVILALILFIKRKMLRKHILILSFAFSYLIILANSSFAISERFHLPVMPFLLIIASYGVTQISTRNKKYFLPYLGLIIVLVIAWNWFKLAGRGAV